MALATLIQLLKTEAFIMKRILSLFIFLCCLQLRAEPLIIKYKPGAEAEMSMLASKIEIFPEANLAFVDADAALFEDHPDVEYVEADLEATVSRHRVSGIDIHPEAWGIAKIQADKLHREGVRGKRNVVVAVLDTGVDRSHVALRGRMWTNAWEDGVNGSNGKDDDGNGYIDDEFGWDFHGNDRDPSDDNNHGTHVAGTIAGRDIGMAPNVRIMALKFLGSNGRGRISDAIKALEYARQKGVDVVNNSWGTRGSSRALNEALGRLWASGAIVVAAAGNNGENNDDVSYSPASHPNVIAVAATDRNDSLASFSNYGPRSVLTAAPGVRIYSSITAGRYALFSGTSMAAPHVAGCAALLVKSFRQDYLFELLRQSSDARGLPVASQGRLNCWRAFRNYR